MLQRLQQRGSGGAREVEQATWPNAEDEDGDAQVIDLVEVLKRSLKGGEGGGARRGAKKAARKTTKKAAARRKAS